MYFSEKIVVFALCNFDFDQTSLQTEVHVNNKNFYLVLQVDSTCYKQEIFTPPGAVFCFKILQATLGKKI